jgi:dipeptidyl aminopeptidase/acylaminoacyl peptidase
MAPPRRVRDEALTLRRTGLRDIELFRARESIYLHQYPTQGRFQVAPNARAIAFTTPGADTLTVVRHDGIITNVANPVHDLFRFSPDGRTLFVLQHWEGRLVVGRVDVPSLQVVLRTPISGAPWMEVCAEGIVIPDNHYNAGAFDCDIMLLPWNGEPRVVAHVDSVVNRLVCAKAGQTIAYFAKSRVWMIPNIGAEPVLVAHEGADVTNAEMSPDGRSLLVLTAKDAHLFQDGKLAKTLGMAHAHTVWFSYDGRQFVVANEQKAVWQRGDKTAVLERTEKAPIRTARFAPMSPWLMVARGGDAIRWNPDQDDVQTIASADEGQEMLAADVFGGGVLIWTGSTWEIEKWPGAKKGL